MKNTKSTSKTPENITKEIMAFY